MNNYLNCTAWWNPCLVFPLALWHISNASYISQWITQTNTDMSSPGLLSFTHYYIFFAFDSPKPWHSSRGWLPWAVWGGTLSPCTCDLRHTWHSAQSQSSPRPWGMLAMWQRLGSRLIKKVSIVQSGRSSPSVTTAAPHTAVVWGFRLWHTFLRQEPTPTAFIQQTLVIWTVFKGSDEKC